MHREFLRKIRNLNGRNIHKYKDIDPEDIFLDSKNLPGFDENRLEGRIERPVDENTFRVVKIIFAMIVLLFTYKLWSLEIIRGQVYAEISENNRLAHTTIFANRGVVYDRNHIPLAENSIKSAESDFAGRSYTSTEGLAHVVGYIKYPLKDKKGFYYEENYQGRDGVELYYNEFLSGKNGLRLTETDALGKVTSESVINQPEDGKPLVLSVDSKVNEAMFKAIKTTVRDRGFTGGTGVMMDVRTGEVIAMTSYPTYDQNIMTQGADRSSISTFLGDINKPFLNRAVGGLYTPGSILKPVVALGALNEKIISPHKQIESKGLISVPNPYDPSKPTIFKDWKAHGWTDMREALAVSSDVYFYSIGGGFGDQKGLGIEKIDKYFKMFGVDEKTGINLPGENQGIIPTPEWKKEKFNGDIWRVGDTYITSIGQYGTQVTPLEAARFIAAIANGGKLIVPSVIEREYGEANGLSEVSVDREVEFNEEDMRVIHEGMRQGVTTGTSVGLNVPYVKVAAKTGTAEIGAAKKYIHSWSVGFFPYENPKYAYALIMEHGPVTNLVGATSVVRQLLDWMSIHTPLYFI